MIIPIVLHLRMSRHMVICIVMFLAQQENNQEKTQGTTIMIWGD